MKRLALIGGLVFVLAQILVLRPVVASACSRPSPYPFTSKNEKYLVEIDSSGRGVAYEVRLTDSEEEKKTLYKFKAPFAFLYSELYVSDDGKKVIDVQAYDDNPGAAVLRFFVKGQMVRSYRIHQLLEDMEKVEWGSCGGGWTGWAEEDPESGQAVEPVRFIAGDSQLKLMTSEGRYFLFSTSTGKIIKRWSAEQ